RGRLQRVRVVEAGGRGRDGAAETALRGTAAQGQRREERGRTPLGAQVPRLLLLGGPGKAGQAQGRAEGHREDEGASAGADAARWSIHQEDCRGAEFVSARMEGVLPPRG